MDHRLPNSSSSTAMDIVYSDAKRTSENATTENVIMQSSPSEPPIVLEEGEETNALDTPWCNPGLENWKVLRSSWKAKCNNRRPESRPKLPVPNSTEICKTLLGTNNSLRVTLPNLVSVLVEVWDERI